MIPVIAFELKYRLRQPSTYVFFALLFVLAFSDMTTDVVQLGGGAGLVKINAPVVLATIVAILTLLSTLISTALIGTAIYRDFESGTHELFFTTRLTKRDYLLGRFIGSYLVTVLVYSGMIWGLMLGTFMPWIDHDKLLPFALASYLQPLLLLILPDLFFLSAIFFVTGALTRNLMIVYTVGIVLFVGYLTALGLVRDIENLPLASLLDPFGFTALRYATRYWTISEQNTRQLTWAGYLLWNRLIWLGVGSAVFAAGYQAFRFDARPLAIFRRKADMPAQAARVEPIAAPAVRLRYGAGALWAQYVSMTRFQYVSLVRSIGFVIITLVGLGSLVSSLLFIDSMFGTAVWPVTRIVSQTVGGGFSFFFLILLTVYAGDLVWKERFQKLDQIYDAAPTSTALSYLSKLTALLLAQALLVLVLILAGILYQVFNGYTRIELGLYLTYLYGTVYPPFALYTVLAFFIHTVVNQKFLGHALIVITFIVSSIVLPKLGFEHNLYIFAGMPTLTYSDMNGYGPFVAPIFWFTLYWSLFAVVLGVATTLLWVRGTQDDWKTRWQSARPRLTPAIGLTAGIAFAAFAAVGVFIYDNTNIQNEYITAKAQKKLQAKYEREYKKYENLPQPRITDIQVEADLYPERRQFDLRGGYVLVNKTGQPISDVHIMEDHRMTIKQMEFSPAATRIHADIQQGYYIYHLAQPLLPGQTLKLAYDVAYLKTGFPNGTPNTDIAENGTFINSLYCPAIGYQPDGELSDNTDRKEQHLGPKRRMPSIDDLAARKNTYVGNDSDWVTFDATVSTDPDQIAIAPGYLQKEWTQAGRRYFHYKMDAKILNFYSFLSARYLVKRDHWNNVAIEIYYQPGHEYNLDRMDDSVKKTLTYDSANYAPYQFRQARILEFPCYQDFAQSFPNTIPYSEGIGFIARIKKPTDLDYPFYVTAHEISHQWWAHQVIGANCQGATMLSESFAEYSALMVMMHEYGAEHMKKFLRYDLDRYLRGRTVEREGEQPLELNENQAYIHYNKGSLVMYALQDQFGEDKIDKVLSDFDHAYAFQNPPYVTSLEFVNRLRQSLPPSAQQTITDQIEKITLYDNRVKTATYTKNGRHDFTVHLVVEAKKTYSDPQGRETPAPINDWIDIGVFGKPDEIDDLGKPLSVQKVRITQPETTFDIHVEKKPRKAGIDPYNKLIDRTPDDNVKTVEEGKDSSD